MPHCPLDGTILFAKGKNLDATRNGHEPVRIVGVNGPVGRSQSIILYLTLIVRNQ